MPTASFNSWPATGESPWPPDSNPFATRYVRPGALPYLFPAGVSAEALVGRLAQLGWRAQISGPHGSGKSTLLQTLVPHLEAAGRRVVQLAPQPAAPAPGGHGVASAAARPEPGRPPREFIPRTFLSTMARRLDRAWDDHTQVVVDGFEQLGWLTRRWFRRATVARGAGLLVTAHRPLGLPELWQTSTSAELARQVVACLLAARPGPGLSPEAVADALAAHQGNLREALFALYDVWENARRCPGRLAGRP